MLKLDFFFTHHLKPDFVFTKKLRSDLFFWIVMLGRQLFLPLCRFHRFFFFATYESKHFFNIQTGPNYFFSQKQREIIFSKSLPVSPPQKQWNGWSLTGPKKSTRWNGGLTFHQLRHWFDVMVDGSGQVQPHGVCSVDGADRHVGDVQGTWIHVDGWERNQAMQDHSERAMDELTCIVWTTPPSPPFMWMMA